MINVAKFVEGDITRFVENTVRQNREVDAQIEAQNEKTIEAYMNKFGVNVDVPDKKKTQKQKANKIAANKSADNSWLTKENLKKMWEETKRKAAEEKQRAKEEELARKEAIKKAIQEEQKASEKAGGRKEVAEKIVAEVLAFYVSDKAPKAAKKVAQKNILPKSKQVIVSAKKAQKQQIAFNSNFMDKLGIKQASTKVMAKSSGKGMSR